MEDEDEEEEGKHFWEAVSGTEVTCCLKDRIDKDVARTTHRNNQDNSVMHIFRNKFRMRCHCKVMQQDDNKRAVTGELERKTHPTAKIATTIK